MNFNGCPSHLWPRGDGSREEGFVLLDSAISLSLKSVIDISIASAVGICDNKKPKANASIIGKNL